jgi:uncharacterized protein (TIGR02266 family)
MSTERIERLAELARRVEQIDGEWRLLDARRRDRSPTLVQLRSLYDWVQDKERDFRERFPDMADATALPEAPDPDDLLDESAESRAWSALSARRSLLEDEWARILGSWEQLAVDWQELLDRRRSSLEVADSGLSQVREKLLARERAISCAIAGVFQAAQETPRVSTDPLFSSPTDLPKGGAAPAAAPFGPTSPAPSAPLPVASASPSVAGSRTAARVSLGVPINLRVEHRLLSGSAENVSLTGVFVRTDTPLPVGREVDLLFDLPERKALHALGKVVWQRPADARGGQGVGVRFGEIPDETRRALESFVRRTGRAVPDEGSR